AELLAYKVLDESGGGFDSDVMAAIEEVARQRPDVVNMSLGRPATADDPVVRALENAAASGIIFCVAAGNGGVFLDIGSPANAPSAITVGAIDSRGALAPFSSKGPVIPDGSIKPEVVAPGVQIVSAWFGGGSRAASGTSMATPHVAGVAALLRDVHPEWPAATLRAAIINSARAMEGEVMAVGAGSVHAVDALRGTVQPSVNTLSFGISDQTQNPWVVSRTITITNPTTVAQSLLLTIDGQREGIEVIPSATSVSLEPGASVPITLELRLDHTKVAAPAFGSLSFGGLVRLAGESPSIAIPWSFVKASRARIKWNGPQTAVVRVATEHMIVRGEATTNAPANLFIGAGSASLWAEAMTQTAAYHVIRDEVDFEASPQITVGPADAPHEIRFAGLDAEGLPLAGRGDGSNRQILLSHPFFANDLLDSFIYAPSDVQFFVSALPSTTRLLAFEAAFDTDPAVTWAAQYAPVEGVDGDTDLTIAPGDWQALSARGVMPAGLDDPYQSVFAASWVFAGREIVMSVSRQRGDPLPITGNTSIEAWITSPVTTDSGTGVLIDIGESGAGNELGIPLANPELVARFTATGDGIVAGHDRLRRLSSKVIASREPIDIGEGPAHPAATVTAFPDMLFASVQWAGPHGEERVYDAKRMEARLYDATGTVIATGQAPMAIPGFPIGAMPGFQMMTPLPEPGAYTFEASTASFRVGGLPARGTVRAAFDSSKMDPAPPVLTSLRVDDGSGRTSATVLHRPVATVTFSAVDMSLSGFGDVRRDRTVVEYRLHGSGDHAWTPLTAEVIAEDFGGETPRSVRPPDGVLHRVNLRDMTLPSGAVDLRIKVEDAAGNSMTYVVEPALVLAPSKRRAVRQP
ncbi:MAG TPA: S8 family serine peptidase, partial [Thermoanaerobaculia bacterium]|nr:S8 family serine peptidase [Thermoanaerobaculia bacterium]